jgi:hypothetical protein
LDFFKLKFKTIFLIEKNSLTNFEVIFFRFLIVLSLLKINKIKSFKNYGGQGFIDFISIINIAKINDSKINFLLQKNHTKITNFFKNIS